MLKLKQPVLLKFGCCVSVSLEKLVAVAGGFVGTRYCTINCPDTHRPADLHIRIDAQIGRESQRRQWALVLPSVFVQYENEVIQASRHITNLLVSSLSLADNGRPLFPHVDPRVVHSHQVYFVLLVLLMWVHMVSATLQIPIAASPRSSRTPLCLGLGLIPSLIYDSNEYPTNQSINSVLSVHSFAAHSQTALHAATIPNDGGGQRQ